jgi:hypothetical protein
MSFTDYDFLTFCDVYVLELLHFETLTFENYYVKCATLSDINIVLYYILSQYRKASWTRSPPNFSFGNKNQNDVPTIM